MTTMNIPLDRFPKVDPSKRTEWAPILCHPKDASWEQFIVGIVAVDSEGFHIEVANQLSRLGCLYDENAMPIALSIEMAIGWLEELLSEDRRVWPEITFPVSNISLGKCEVAVGLPRKAVAQQWMGTLSSFHKTQQIAMQVSLANPISAAKNSIKARSQRLPVQVLSLIEKQEPSLLGFFHEDVRNKSARRTRANARVKIDYNGRYLSANIDKFNVDSPAATVGILKERMWDLAIQRERSQKKASLHRDFEMLVEFPQHHILDKRPSSVERIQEHLRELTKQADSNEIRFRTLPGAQQIGEHILKRELA